MDASSVLWTNWHEQLKELLSGIHGQERENARLLCAGYRLVSLRRHATGSRNRQSNAASVRPR